MSKTSQILSVLGFANRARRLSLGTMATVMQLRKGKAKMVIIAHDAAANTRSEIEPFAKEMKVPVLNGPSKVELGERLGRRAVAIVGVLDAGFAKSLKKVAPN